MLKHGALLFAAIAGAADAQPSGAKQPVFDVPAIRPTDMSAPRDTCYMKGQAGGQTFTGRCMPLRLMIKYAYKIVDSQIVNAPAWIDSELHDFEAKSDHPVTRADIAAMFQQFITDRFGLQFHREQRMMSAFVLSIDKSGNKMTPNTRALLSSKASRVTQAALAGCDSDSA